MKAIIRTEPLKVTAADIEKPSAGADEVIVRVAYAGICGSDIQRVREDNPKWNTIALGHEFSGIVDEVGSDVENIKRGDRVAAVPLEPCHKCEWCQQGYYSLCESYSFVGSRKNGAFAEYVRVKAANIIPIDDELSLKQAALLEPITVSLHPVLDLGTIAGKNVLVIGAGTIGLLAVSAVKMMGPASITVSDVVDEKLSFAAEGGADYTVNSGSEALPEYYKIHRKPDIILECSGTNFGKVDALSVCNGRGTIVLVGTAAKSATFEPDLMERINRKELTIKGSWMNYSAPWPGREWEIAVQLLKQGYIKADKIISHVFKADEAQKAYDIVYSGKPYLKILFDMGVE